MTRPRARSRVRRRALASAMIRWSLVLVLPSHVACGTAGPSPEAPTAQANLPEREVLPAATADASDEAGEDAAVASPVVAIADDSDAGAAETAAVSSGERCKRDADCTVRYTGCCPPCTSSGWLPMRVDRAKRLAAECRAPVPCPACAAPALPAAACTAGVCTTAR